MNSSESRRLALVKFATLRVSAALAIMHLSGTLGPQLNLCRDMAFDGCPMLDCGPTERPAQWS